MVANCLTQVAQIFDVVRSYFACYHFSYKTALAIVWETLGKFGLLFILTSGHTGWDPCYKSLWMTLGKQSTKTSIEESKKDVNSQKWNPSSNDPLMKFSTLPRQTDSSLDCHISIRIFTLRFHFSFLTGAWRSRRFPDWRPAKNSSI